MLLPTKSGLMGSSRCPRSISTARRMARGPAAVEHGVYRRPGRPAGVYHVVHQHHHAPLHLEGQGGGAHYGPLRARPQVVPVERDVHAAAGRIDALYALDVLRNPPGQRLAPALYAHQAQPLGSAVLSVISCDSRMSARPSAASSIILAFTRKKIPPSGGHGRARAHRAPYVSCLAGVSAPA